jgi:hypothetical protein
MVRYFAIAVALLFSAFPPLCFAADKAQTGAQTKGAMSQDTKEVRVQKSSTSLAPILAKMRSENKLVTGKNLVLESKAQGSTPAIKLMAIVNRGKVTKWEAVDANGKGVPTAVYRSAAEDGGITTECWVCAIIKTPDGGQSKSCYKIDCKDAPKPSLMRM